MFRGVGESTAAFVDLLISSFLCKLYLGKFVKYDQIGLLVKMQENINLSL